MPDTNQWAVAHGTSGSLDSRGNVAITEKMRVGEILRGRKNPAETRFHGP